LVKAVAVQTGQEARTVDATLKGLTDVIMGVAAKGEPVAISGFAKFARVETKARMGRNPATGAPVKIPARKKARITALKGFKDALLTPSLAPKLAKGVWPPEAAPAKAPARKAPARKAPVRKAPARAAKAPARATKAPARTAKAPARKAPAARATAARKR